MFQLIEVALVQTASFGGGHRGMAREFTVKTSTIPTGIVLKAVKPFRIDEIDSETESLLRYFADCEVGKPGQSPESVKHKNKVYADLLAAEKIETMGRVVQLVKLS